MKRIMLWGVLGISLAVFAASEGKQALPEAGEERSAEAFGQVMALLRDTNQGGKTPSKEDLQKRQEAGRALAKAAEEFLKKYPRSKQAEDAQAFWGMGLFAAAVSGDGKAKEELQERSAAMLKDEALPEMVKMHTYVLNYIGQKAIKAGVHHLDMGSTEFHKDFMEGLFAAAEVLRNKGEIFKMILLEAKSGRELTDPEKRSLAERVFKHPAADAETKATAQEILTGEKSYAVGKPLELKFTAVDGRKVDLAEMRGKVVLIDFWATWCGPCVAEVPNVKRAYTQFHGKGFEIVGISLDEDKEALLSFIKKNEMTWPQYFDGKQWNNDLSFRFGINAVPTMWLVDKKGILRSTESRGDLEREVEELIKAN